MTSNNRCDIVIEIFCNGDILHGFSNLRSWEEEDTYYQFSSEGDESEDDIYDVCDRMKIWYADCEAWLLWAVDCEVDEVLGCDLNEALEWGDTDEIPF